jgi:hypothetical protein
LVRKTNAQNGDRGPAAPSPQELDRFEERKVFGDETNQGDEEGKEHSPCREVNGDRQKQQQGKTADGKDAALQK